jgi:hypothetical protein
MNNDETDVQSTLAFETTEEGKKACTMRLLLVLPWRCCYKYGNEEPFKSAAISIKEQE